MWKIRKNIDITTAKPNDDVYGQGSSTEKLIEITERLVKEARIIDWIEKVFGLMREISKVILRISESKNHWALTKNGIIILWW